MPSAFLECAPPQHCHLLTPPLVLPDLPNRGKDSSSVCPACDEAFLHTRPPPSQEAYLRGIHYAHQGVQEDGEEGGDSQGQSLSAPEERHDDDGVGTGGFLWAGGEQKSGWKVRPVSQSHVTSWPREKTGHWQQCRKSLQKPQSLIPESKVSFQNGNKEQRKALTTSSLTLGGATRCNPATQEGLESLELVIRPHPARGEGRGPK